MKIKTSNKNQKGVVLLNVLIFSMLAISLVTFFVIWVSTSIKVARSTLYKEQAFQIAESGVDYYRWHLAHSPSDFKDGTGSNGPYVHDFKDKNGNVVGNFTLTITPPISGSTIVTIKSEGRVNNYPSVVRTVQTKLAIPSFAKFAVVANDFMRFGEGTEIFGPVHSNGGIRFDGVAHNLITSAASTFNDPDHTGNNEFGVHTHASAFSSNIDESFRPQEAPPTNPVPSRTDVFMIGRQFPVPQADFTGITNDLSSIKANAISGGFYLPASGGSTLGYHIVFKTNDTFSLYKVKSLETPSSGGCKDDEEGWGTWSIKPSVGETLMGTYPNPANGLIFVEDDVWIDGKINTARITVAAGTFPDKAETRNSIYINKDLLYTNYDGRDSIGLIAQKNITVGMFSDTDLRIDAALMANNGKVGRYYYNSYCSPHHLKNRITLYGMIGSSKRYGFAYINSGTNTGYDERVIIYDANLLYGPPPSFPLTSDKYTTISWEEIE